MKWGDPSFSGILLGLYLGMLSLLWAGMTAGISAWQRKNALPRAKGAHFPRLSICIPARNEAHQIGACVRAALAQTHPSFEVILVDDSSTDGTAEAALAAANGDPRFRLIRGKPLAPGWAGKPWALSQASAEANGQHLLFIDADVELAPDAAEATAAVMLERQLSMLSIFGTWKLDSFWERVIIPVVGWFVRGTIDMDAVNTPGRKEAFANGQFILVDHAAYDAVGGHGAVKQTVLDDVRLAQVVKQRGVRLGLYHAPDLFSVRLYRSFSEIVDGYSKNFYEGMDRRPLLAFGVLLFLFIGSGLPYLLLLLLLIQPGLVLAGLRPEALWAGWLLLVCALPVAFRFRVEKVDGRSGALAWTHPLGNLMLAWILLRSVFAIQTQWKGRVFHDGRMKQ